MSRRKRGAALLVAATVAASTGCSGIGGDRPHLIRLLGNPAHATGGWPGVSPTHHADVGSMIVCASSPGIHIESVRPVGTEGTIHVVAFRVRPSPFVSGAQGVGAEYGSLDSLGLAAKDRTVVPCSSKGGNAGSEIAIEMSIPAGANAAARGWTITASDGKRSSSVTFPLGVVLCSAPTMDAPACQTFQRAWSGHAAAKP